MRCTTCAAENPEHARFCLECGAEVGRRCAACGAELPGRAKFCLECGRAIGSGRPPPAPEPRSYTPKHLAEKILTSRTALEGERKQVTVLFADVKGSMELTEQVDPEAWRKIMDRFFAILSEGIHRFEGTINQYTRCAQLARRRSEHACPRSRSAARVVAGYTFVRGGNRDCR
jgi:class 3 adenylate cyclase